jgi:hypothetical protein
MVTSQKMSENEMGYRGSKSIIFKSLIVKEQRVDGSYINSNFLASQPKTLIQNSMLRCTLTGFERSYQVKALSSITNKRFYSSKGENSKLNP